MKKKFVTDIVFRYTITVCQSLLWLPLARGKTSAGSLFYHIAYRKVVSVNR